MIDTAEQTTTECLACGSPIIQIAGRGHRKRLYCDDRCRQQAHRQRTQTHEQVTAEARFKSWLRRRRLPQDADFLKLFLDDTRLPYHASRSMYIARLKQYGYTAEDIAMFEEAWKDMLFNQS